MFNKKHLLAHSQRSPGHYLRPASTLRDGKPGNSKCGAHFILGFQPGAMFAHLGPAIPMKKGLFILQVAWKIIRK